MVGAFVLGAVVGLVVATPGEDAVPAVEGDARPGRGGLVVEWPGDVPDRLARLRTTLRRSGVVEEAAAALDARVALPVEVTVEVRSCPDGTGYLPGESLVELCLEDVARTRLDLEAADAEDVGATVLGIVRETVLHEAGHAFIDVLELPYTGREEDVADQLAAWVLVGSGDEEAVEALLSASYEYEVLAASYEADAGDEHAPDAQRAVNYLCWVHGSDPAEWDGLVDGEPLTEQRAERCEEEWDDLDRGWRTMLDDAGALRPTPEG